MLKVMTSVTDYYLVLGVQIIQLIVINLNQLFLID